MIVSKKISVTERKGVSAPPLVSFVFVFDTPFGVFLMVLYRWFDMTSVCFRFTDVLVLADVFDLYVVKFCVGDT